MSTQKKLTYPDIATESEEQSTLFQWAARNEHQHPELKLLYHIPNGGLRNKPVAVRLTAQGVRRGVPDLCLPVARGSYHGMYIELKRRVGGKIAPEQMGWLEELGRQGYYALVCKGWEQAKNEIEKYLNTADAV
jgi:hypothetical protein